MGTSASKDETLPVSIERFTSRVPPSLIRRELIGYATRDDFYASSWAGLKVAVGNLRTNSTRSNLSLKPTEGIPFVSFSNINFLLTHFSTLETGFTKTPNNGFFVSVRTLSPVVSNNQERLDLDLLDWWFSNTDNQNLFRLSHPQRHLDCHWDEEFSSAGGWERQKGHYINHSLDFLVLLKRKKEEVKAKSLTHLNSMSSINLADSELQTANYHTSSSTVYNNDYELNSHVIDLNYNDTNTNYPSQYHSYNNITRTNSISSSLKWSPSSGGGCGLNGLNYSKKSNDLENLFSKTRIRYEFLSPSSLNIDLKRLKIERVTSCIIADMFISDEDNKIDPYYDLSESTESFSLKDHTGKYVGGIKEDYMEILKKRIRESKLNQLEKEKEKDFNQTQNQIEDLKPKEVIKSDLKNNLTYIGKVLFLTKIINGKSITHVFYWLGCHDIVQDNLVSTTSLNSPHSHSAALTNDSTLTLGSKSDNYKKFSSTFNFNNDTHAFFSNSKIDSNLALAKDLYEYTAEWMTCLREFLPSYVNQHYINEQNLQYEYYQQQEELVKEMNNENENLARNFNFKHFYQSNNSNNGSSPDQLITINESEKSTSPYNTSVNQSGVGSSLVSLAPSIAFQQQQQFFNNYQGEESLNSQNITQSETDLDLYQAAYHVPEDFGY